MSQHKKVVRPNPVILQMRLSQVRSLIERMSAAHSDLAYPLRSDAPNISAARHRGWAHCDCDVAKILREFSGAIHNHLDLKPRAATPYRMEFARGTRNEGDCDNRLFRSSTGDPDA